MMIMMLAWRVRGGRAQGFKHGNLWTTPVGWRLVLLFPIFSANGSPQLALLYGESGFRVGTTQVGAWRRTRRRYIITLTLSPHKNVSIITWPVCWSLIGWKADHVTRLLGPHKNVAIHRDQQTGKMLSEFHSEGLQYSIFRAFHSTKESVEEDL